jgi:hypothetical protein
MFNLFKWRRKPQQVINPTAKLPPIPPEGMTIKFTRRDNV